MTYWYINHGSCQIARWVSWPCVPESAICMSAYAQASIWISLVHSVNAFGRWSWQPWSPWALCPTHTQTFIYWCRCMVSGGQLRLRAPVAYNTCAGRHRRVALTPTRSPVGLHFWVLSSWALSCGRAPAAEVGAAHIRAHACSRWLQQYTFGQGLLAALKDSRLRLLLLRRWVVQLRSSLGHCKRWLLFKRCLIVPCCPLPRVQISSYALTPADIPLVPHVIRAMRELETRAGQL